MALPVDVVFWPSILQKLLYINLHPSFLQLTLEDGIAESDFSVAIGEGGVVLVWVGVGVVGDGVVEGFEGHFVGVGETFGVTSGGAGKVLGVGVVEAGIFEEGFVGLFTVTSPDLVGFFAVPLKSSAGAGDFVAKAVFAAWGDLGNKEGSSDSAFETKHDSAIVIGGDVDGFGGLLGIGLAGKGLDFTQGAFADGMEDSQIGEDVFDIAAGDVLDEVNPVSADVGNGPELALFLGQNPPVVVGIVEEPVLLVTAEDGMQVTQLPGFDPLLGFKVNGVEADVVVHSGGKTLFFGKAYEFSGFLGGHGQRFFAEDVFASIKGFYGLLKVESIGGCDMDGIDIGVVDEVFVGGIGFGEFQLFSKGLGFFRCGALNADDFHATKSLEGFGVHRAHEAGSGDRHFYHYICVWKNLDACPAPPSTSIRSLTLGWYFWET